MNIKRIAVVSTVAVVAAAGAAGAVAATSDDGKKAEDAVLADAAKRLDVSPEQLRNALGAAEDAQLDQAVKDGKLTQAQADAIKKRRQESGRVLGIGPGGHHGFGPGGPRGAMAGGLDDLAKALGLTRAKLLEQLRDGKSIEDIAKAQNKDLDDVKASLKSAARKRLDQAVKDGKLTDAQRDEILSHLDDRIDNLEDGGKFGPGFGHGGGPPDGAGPPDGDGPPAGAAFDGRFS